jgi:DNA modification methylase
MTARLLIGDVFERMAELPDASVDLVLTSPPFLALRSYLPADHPDKAKEIGSEPSPAVFLDTLLRLTAEWRRLLAPHGSICVELGDTYSGAGGDNHLWDTYTANGQGGTRYPQNEKHPAGTGKRDTSSGWPLAKSLTCTTCPSPTAATC